LWHSAAHASHILLQSAQSWFAKRESRPSNRAHKAQMSAQSRHRKAHSLSPRFMQSVTHASQVITQARQASIHSFEFFISRNISNTRINSFVAYEHDVYCVLQMSFLMRGIF
jgi:hypothetical protein